MRENILNDQGTLIAWLDAPCGGDGQDNERCQHEHREGRPFHIIPAHTDPRARDCHLALPTYHYATRGEAVEALEAAWEAAVPVDNAADRDAAYARRVPVKVAKSGRY